MESKIHSFITSESRTAKSEFKEYLESLTKDDLIKYYKSIGYKMSSSKTKQDLIDTFVKEFVKARKNIKSIGTKGSKSYDLRVPKKEIDEGDILYKGEFTLFSSPGNISYHKYMTFPKFYTQELSQIYSVKHKTYPELISSENYPFMKNFKGSLLKDILYVDKTGDDDDWYENYDIKMIAKLENKCYVLHIVSYANEYIDIDENDVYVFKTYEDLIDALPLNLYNNFIKSTKKA
jgi:hypothetical protein